MAGNEVSRQLVGEPDGIWLSVGGSARKQIVPRDSAVHGCPCCSDCAGISRDPCAPEGLL